MPGTWCCDESIAFAYSHFDGSGDGEGLPDALLIMNPTVAFCLTMARDTKEVQAHLDALKVETRELIICPINDNENLMTADGGHHWSLLVAWATARHPVGPHRLNFAYYDSLADDSGSRNSRSLRHAEKIAARLAGTRVKLSPAPCANQNNWYDCGIYTIMFSEIILNAVRKAHQSSPFVAEGAALWESQLAKITPRDATKCRARYFKKAVEAGLERDAKNAQTFGNPSLKDEDSRS
jgi:sentrin-specific protease 8